MTKPYYPNQLKEQAAWFSNFYTEFPNYGSILGFSGPEIVTVLNDCKAAQWMINDVLNTYEKLYSEVSGWVHSVFDAPSGSPLPQVPTIPAWPPLPASTTAVAAIDARRIATVDRCKSSLNYSPEVMGAALRIEPTGTPFDPNTWQAVIRSSECTGPAQVRLKVAKAGGAVSANAVYCRRQGDPSWMKTGVFLSAEIVDDTPCAEPGQPEQREYQIRSVIKDAEIGLASEIVTVVVRG